MLGCWGAGAQEGDEEPDAHSNAHSLSAQTENQPRTREVWGSAPGHNSRSAPAQHTQASESALSNTHAIARTRFFKRNENDYGHYQFCCFILIRKARALEVPQIRINALSKETVRLYIMYRREQDFKCRIVVKLVLVS